MIATALIVIAVFYFSICAMVYLRQGRLVYVPSRPIAATPDAAGMAYEAVTLTTPDGEKLGAWFVPVPAPASKTWTVLYCHGNAGNIGDRVDPIKSILDMGFNVFIFDYRGYGTSTGTPTEAGTYQDALTAWKYLIEERRVPPERILIYGHSLGCAIACWLAGEVRPGALMLEAPFTSTTDMGVRMFPLLPVRLLSRFRYDNLERIGRVRCPILIAHARGDQTVPFPHGKRVFELAREPKHFIEFSGDHNKGMEQDQAYRDGFLEWFAGVSANANPLTPTAKRP